MTLLESDRLVFRNWQDSDRPLFHLINSDDRVMEFFPFRRTRDEADAKMDEFVADIGRDGFGWAAATLKETGEPIGFIGLAHADHLEPHLPKDAIQIGWRLAPQYWGKGYASEGARAWLQFGFEQLGLPEILSYAVWNNKPSITVMQRIGMQPDPGSDFNHPQSPADRPGFERIVVYRLTGAEWSKEKRLESRFSEMS